MDEVIIQIGINDLKQISYWSDNNQALVSNCKRNIDYIASRAKKIAKRVVVSTVFPLGNRPFWRKVLLGKNVKEAINEVNAHIRVMEGVEVFDAYEFLVDDKGYVKDVYSKDTLHINERAYKEMVDRHLSVSARVKIQ